MKRFSLFLILSVFAMVSAYAQSDTKLSEGAKAVYTFLRDNFGKKTISGIMTGDRIRNSEKRFILLSSFADGITV